MELDLNKIDKVILISTIVMLVLITSTFLFCLFTAIFYGTIQIKVSFALIDLVMFFILPICTILQIITFIIKIFSKNKVKKDWIIIFVNFMSVIIQSAILFVFFVSITNPLL